MRSEFAEHYSKIFPLNPRQLDFIRGELGERGSLIDLGCGPGELCHALLREGHDCLGIDNDEEMIRVARSRGSESKFLQMSIEEIRGIDRVFDVGVCLGNVISHVDGATLGDMLKSVSRVLRPGGAWICQMVNSDVHLREGAYEFPVIERQDLRLHREYDGDRQTVRFTIRLERDGREIHRGASTLWPLPVKTHVRKNSAAGFELTTLLADWDGSAFDSSRDRSVILVFRRP